MGNLKKIALFTNDVETTSLVRNELFEDVIPLLENQAMPLLLDAYARYQVKTTFFFTGYLAERSAKLVRMVWDQGHEVACHGYSHKVNKAFDVLSFKEQLEHLKKAKSILENITGEAVVSFRAPALMESGFLIDSSVASQRFDMFLSYGSGQKLKWLTAPRRPYFTKPDDLTKRGNSNLLEVPVSALIIPYIGTTLRMLPFPVRLIRSALAFESTINGKPINFLTHPNEFMDEAHSKGPIARRSGNFVKYLLADLIRNKLKMKNLGSSAIAILEKELAYFLRKGFSFLTMKEYRNLIVNSNGENR
jgi:peptidoglycan/xylan/chitin deacetylase (PgdA/CDA1 family)